jgi:hypothetical protein
MTTAEAARFYRSRHGWNPLPSRDDSKRPIGCYAELWDTPVAEMILDRWDARNIQLICGVRWNLAVIDLDGDGVDVWQSLALYRPNPRTWTVRTRRGFHLWFRIAADVRELPSRTVWSGESHNAVELIGDRKLVVAPPSDYGHRYEFAVGPADMPEPALMPGWMVKLGDVRRHEPEPYVPPAPVLAPLAPSGRSFDRQAVLASIKDKVALVRRWGVRVLSGRPGRHGWLRCHALNRIDRVPSAGFHPASGYYSEPPCLRMSLFDLAVVRGVYPTWADAVNGLGHQFLSRGI